MTTDQPATSVPVSAPAPVPVPAPMPTPAPAPVSPGSGERAAGVAYGTGRVADDARQRGLDIEIVERPAADSLDEAAALLGLDSSDVVKSLVVKRHNGDYLFALVPGDRQISWSKLRSIVGVNKLSLPSPEAALEVTGYERGTITPFGSRTDLPVYADERMLGRRVALGAGAHGRSLLTDADALLAAFGATVADITDPLKPRA